MTADDHDIDDTRGAEATGSAGSIDARARRAGRDAPAPRLPDDWRAGVMASVRASARAPASTLASLAPKGLLVAAAAASLAALLFTATGTEVNPVGTFYNVLWQDPGSLIDLTLLF